eukprot:2207442-Lingulodinium_polyedra.AAC.1
MRRLWAAVQQRSNWRQVQGPVSGMLLEFESLGWSMPDFLTLRTRDNIAMQLTAMAPAAVVQ